MCKVSKIFSFWQKNAKKSWSRPKQLKNAAVRPNKLNRPNKRRVATRTDSPISGAAASGSLGTLWAWCRNFRSLSRSASGEALLFMCVFRAGGYSPASKR